MKLLELKCPILILSHHNCELHCCQLDGYKKHTTALLNRMRIIEDEISGKPLNAKFRIWYNLDENYLDKATMKTIADSVFRLQNHILKIAFIGLHGITKWRFEYILKQVLDEKSIIRAYFTDAEQAKEWLV